MPDTNSQILIFGCGNMGGAMLRGWIAGAVEPSRFVVVDPVATELPDGVTVYRAASDLLGQKFDSILLGIKPQMVGTLEPQIAPLLNANALLISILAGTQVSTLAGHFPTVRIVRLMPNLAAAIGKSPLGLWSPDLDSQARENLESVLAPLGTPIWLNNEGQMDAVTALAGSGPAFVYRFMEALGMGGTRLGLPPDLAARLVSATIEGAALLAAQSDETPRQLAARVASPGGTTAAGLAVLDAGNALSGFIYARLRAARDRGTELSGDARHGSPAQ